MGLRALKTLAKPKLTMTIAYSNKHKVWTTRYSFEPTCYASTDNFFVSSKDGKGVWLHDDNEERCHFYGDPFGAELEVVSNNDPSAVKIFKSISIETNEDDWTAEVFTNDEYTGNEKQEGAIDSFIPKEGYKYADTPRSSINSSSNIVPCPSPVTLNAIPSGSAVNGISFSVLLPFTPNISLPLSANTRVYVLEDGNLVNPGSDVSSAGIEMTATGFAPSPLGTVVTLEFIASSQNPVTVVVDLKNALAEADNQFYEQSLFLVSPASVNGDTMRGPYLRAKIKTETTDALELHAINVDYEFSKLDARLTQNT